MTFQTVEIASWKHFDIFYSFPLRRRHQLASFSPSVSKRFEESENSHWQFLTWVMSPIMSDFWSNELIRFWDFTTGQLITFFFNQIWRSCALTFEENVIFFQEQYAEACVVFISKLYKNMPFGQRCANFYIQFYRLILFFLNIHFISIMHNMRNSLSVIHHSSCI